MLIQALKQSRAFNDWWCGKGKRALVAAVPCMQHADRNEWGIAEAGARVAWEAKNQQAPNELLFLSRAETRRAATDLLGFRAGNRPKRNPKINLALSQPLAYRREMKNNMTDREQQIESLKENGRNLFDTMQKNLSWQTGRTDADITANPDPMAEVFGSEQNDPKEYRAYARRTQDKLDRQGREAFAAEYAETQIKNLTV
jgi:hypothetical protein